MVAGVELRRDGIFSSRLAATALYTTSPSVAYLRIDLRIHHNRKEHCWVVRLQVDTTQTLAAMPLPIECVVMAGADLLLPEY